jgi:hypothetical protein
VSQQKRKLVEQGFGWSKVIGLLRQLRHRGLARVGWIFTFTHAAYNLVRLRTLIGLGCVRERRTGEAGRRNGPGATSRSSRGALFRLGATAREENSRRIDALFSNLLGSTRAVDLDVQTPAGVGVMSLARCSG